MQLSLRSVSSLLFLAPLALALASTSTSARADDAGANPCGTFNFSSGLSCKIETSGGCVADCTPLKIEANCSGGCTGTANTTCVNDCGTQCIAQCNPALLDCFAGCHTECDGTVQSQCTTAHSGDGTDCAAQSKAQCDIHCKDSCKVPPSSCQEHCTKCCTGSCTTQVNFSCDFSCFASVQGGCNVQCSKPEGAIFCNGNYVHASDVQQCIAYLATQGINVDVSARGSATCDLTGCHSAGTANGKSCAVSPGSSTEMSAVGVGALVFVATGIFARRRKNRR